MGLCKRWRGGGGDGKCCAIRMMQVVEVHALGGIRGVLDHAIRVVEGELGDVFEVVVSTQGGDGGLMDEPG